MGFIFDLDGTLLNSLDDLKNSLNTVLRQYNLPVHTSKDYQQFVGNGMKVLVDRAIPENHPQRDEILKDFLTEYGQRYYENSRPYDGIIEMLKTLNKKNVPFSICTNKKQEYTDEIVKRFFCEIDFMEVVGDQFDGLHKPNPFYPLKIAEKMKTDPKDMYFVGDSDVDIKTALNAKMKPIGVSWGFRSVKELREAGAILIIDNPNELFKLL